MPKVKEKSCYQIKVSDVSFLLEFFNVFNEQNHYRLYIDENGFEASVIEDGERHFYSYPEDGVYAEVVAYRLLAKFELQYLPGKLIEAGLDMLEKVVKGETYGK